MTPSRAVSASTAGTAAPTAARSTASSAAARGDERDQHEQPGDERPEGAARERQVEVEPEQRDERARHGPHGRARRPPAASRPRSSRRRAPWPRRGGGASVAARRARPPAATGGAATRRRRARLPAARLVASRARPAISPAASTSPSAASAPWRVPVRQRLGEPVAGGGRALELDQPGKQPLRQPVERGGGDPGEQRGLRPADREQRGRGDQRRQVEHVALDVVDARAGQRRPHERERGPGRQRRHARQRHAPGRAARQRAWRHRRGHRCQQAGRDPRAQAGRVEVAPAREGEDRRAAPAGRPRRSDGASRAGPYPRRLANARPTPRPGAGAARVRPRARATARAGLLGHEDRPARRSGRIPGRRRRRLVVDGRPRPRPGRPVRRLPVPDGAVLRARPRARPRPVAGSAALARVAPRAGGLGRGAADGRARRRRGRARTPSQACWCC